MVAILTPNLETSSELYTNIRLRYRLPIKFEL